jgi:hypothetical protein
MDSLLNANSSFVERLVFADARRPPFVLILTLGCLYLYIGSLGAGCVTDVNTCVSVVTALPMLYFIEIVMAVSVLRWGRETPLTVVKQNIPRILG